MNEEITRVHFVKVISESLINKTIDARRVDTQSFIFILVSSSLHISSAPMCCLCLVITTIVSRYR